MTTTAPPRPDTVDNVLDQIQLDRGPVCEVLYVADDLDRSTGTWRRCHGEAAWVARIGCCGLALLVCHEHRTGRSWGCRVCGRPVANARIGWTAL